MTGPENPYSHDARSGVKLSDVMNAATRDSELNLRVCFPATVKKVTDGGARVEISPDMKTVLSADNGDFIVEYEDVFSVQVWTYGQGKAGGGYLQFPVEVGQKGWVMVSDRSLDGWYQNGLRAQPAGYHTHEMTDGVFMPGARDKTIALTQDTTAAVLEHDSIKLGQAAALFAARKFDAVKAAPGMVAWMAAVNSAILAIPGPSIPPPSDFGIISEGSDKVKIE
jgi:hypothetical protein